jgi:hypothetical protein
LLTKKGVFELKEQVDLLRCFDDIFWKKVYRTLPDHWAGSKIFEVQRYLASITANLNDFTASINKTLMQ